MNAKIFKDLETRGRADALAIPLQEIPGEHRTAAAGGAVPEARVVLDQKGACAVARSGSVYAGIQRTSTARTGRRAQV